jgi:hypothetical protein
MFLTAEASIFINSNPDAVWDYASDPKKWTASNPEEHFGLVYNNPLNRPGEGVEFHQRESVAGWYADLRGKILYVQEQRVVVWAGIAYYPVFFGLIKVRIAEGGTIKIDRTSQGSALA